MNTIKLTAMDFTIILDTLRGSMGIADNGRLFGYSEKTRTDVMNNLIFILSNIAVSIETEPE